MKNSLAFTALRKLALESEHDLDESFFEDLIQYRDFLESYGISDEEFDVVATALGSACIARAKDRLLTDRDLEKTRIAIFGCSLANGDCNEAAQAILDRPLKKHYEG